MKMTLKLTRKLALIGIMLFVILFAAWYFGSQHLSPRRAAYQTSSQMANEQQALLTRMSHEGRSEEDLQSELEDLEIYLPFEENTDQLLESLNALQQGLDVEIEQIIKLEGESNIPAEGFTVSQTMFQVEVIYSDLDDLRQLITDFTEVDRIIELVSLSYEQLDENSGTGSFTIRTYYQGEE